MVALPNIWKDSEGIQSVKSDQYLGKVDSLPAQTSSVHQGKFSALDCNSAKVLYLKKVNGSE